MDTPHTPGPWTWNIDGELHGGKSGRRSVLALEDDGACGDPDCCGSPTYNIAVSSEDARLIAAAPDLLIAAKAALNDRQFKDWPDIATLLIDAITKAEG